MSAEETYTVQVQCENCGYRGRLELPKGTPFESELGVLNKRTCPVCECETLRKLL